MKALRHISAVLFLCSIMTFPLSFMPLKLGCLALFVGVHVIDYRWNEHFRVSSRILIFYCCVAIGGMIWALVGLYGSGALRGVQDNLRLFVAWSMAYLLILTLLRNDDGLRYLHSAIVISGLLIASINLYGLYDGYAQIGLVSEGVREALRLNVGFHEGYVQMSSHNIASLLFITPYLIGIQFLENTRGLNGKWVKLSLIACVVLAAFSGRRALWLCVVMTPLIIGALAFMSGTMRTVRPLGQKLIGLMAFGVVIGLVLMVILKTQPEDTGIGILDHMVAAFSAEDERTIQRDYLVSAFMDEPIVGSGFGAYAGYLRNDELPWLYELSYFQMLFNFGLIGVLYWILLSGAYLFLACRVVREKSDATGQPLCLLVGLFAFLIGAYSNPYFGAFDYLIYVAILPYVASLRGMNHGATGGKLPPAEEVRIGEMQLGAR
jgi:hypothetical protein